MLNERKDIFAGNVAIVQSQESNSLLPSTILVQDFLGFTGDITKTVQLKAFSSEAVEETPWIHVKSLFGSWLENGKEDKQIEELYKSRYIPSSMLDDKE